MPGEKGMQYKKKSFVIPAGKSIKKCMRGDCLNEPASCESCVMVQGKYIYYQPNENKILNTNLKER